ncbi:MAG: PIN domain-containing protein [Patescibacteria group bacterium]|nr:PIN domain-containing protein [Patescibacteria group bacterium]
MIILDSNIWISFLDKNDNQHKKAVKIMEKIDCDIVVPEYVIIEVCTVLLKKTNKKIADGFIEIAFNNQNTKVLFFDEYFFNIFVNNFKSIQNKNLSFIDIALLYLSETYDVITFDKNLEKAMKNKI